MRLSNEKNAKINAPSQRMSVQEITSEVSTGPARRSRQLTLMLLPTIFANALTTASSVDQAKAIRADIESQKALLGTALFAN